MFLNCPRCDAFRLDSSGNCNNCGYSLRISCSSCGCKNIPLARFCGSCGGALSLNSWFQRLCNRHISFFARLKIRKLAAGLAFGTLLGTFAFGTMGMHSFSRQGISESAPKRFANSEFALQNRLCEKLLEFRNLRDPKATASSQDLRRFTEILLQHLASLEEFSNANDNARKTANADDYLLQARASSVVKRSNVALLIFNIASEYLKLNYRDFEETENFTDIPRFHFLSIPSSALSSLGIGLSRNATEFGISDPVKIEELVQAGMQLSQAGQVRLKQKVFCSLLPR